MRRFLLLLAVFAQLPAVASHDPHSPTPWYLPRGAFLGVAVQGDVVTPRFHLLWELTLIQERRDSLQLVLDAGLGYAVSRPSAVISGQEVRADLMYQHGAGLGLGYQGLYGHVHVGAHVVSGVLFYGARFNGLERENRVTGYVDGRAQLGWKLGPVVVGLSGGGFAPFQRPSRSRVAPSLGGFTLGLFADWRVGELRARQARP